MDDQQRMAMDKQLTQEINDLHKQEEQHFEEWNTGHNHAATAIWKSIGVGWFGGLSSIAIASRSALLASCIAGLSIVSASWFGYAHHSAAVGAERHYRLAIQCSGEISSKYLAISKLYFPPNTADK